MFTALEPMSAPTFTDSLISICSSFSDVISGTRQIGSGSFLSSARSHDSASSVRQ